MGNERRGEESAAVCGRKMIGRVECGGHEIKDAKFNEDWHLEDTPGPA